MVRCSILGCKSDSEKKLPGLSFHSFPENDNLRRKWIEATGRINWAARKTSRICSIHFEKNVLIKKKKQTVLYPNAVPSQHSRSTRDKQASSPVDQLVEPKTEILGSPISHQDNSINDNFESCENSETVEIKLEIEESLIDIEETGVNLLSTRDMQAKSPVDPLAEPKTEILEPPSDHRDYTIKHNFQPCEVAVEPKMETESPCDPEQVPRSFPVESRVNWTVGPKMQIVISPNLECTVNPRVESCLNTTVEQKTGSTTDSGSEEDPEECVQNYNEFKIPTLSTLKGQDVIEFHKMANRIIKLENKLNVFRKKLRATTVSRNRFKRRIEKQSNIIRELQNRLSLERMKNSEKDQNLPLKNLLTSITNNEKNDKDGKLLPKDSSETVVGNESKRRRNFACNLPSKKSLNSTVGNESNYRSNITSNFPSKHSLKPTISSERNNITNFVLLKGRL